MRGIAVLLLLALGAKGFAQSLPVFDKDFGCITTTQAHQYVRDFNIDLQSFGGEELCNPAVDTKKLFDDLSLIHDGQFAGSTANLFIRNFVPRDQYYTWMESETRGMQRGNDIPYATAYNAGGYFTMQNGWTKLSTLGRVGTIVHEARHTEGYGHVVCTHGPYNGTEVEGCDESVEEGGAHAIEMEYYARVAVQGVNFHPVYKSMARLMALARANFVFNQDPMEETDAIVALTNQGLIRVTPNGLVHLDLALGNNSGALELKRTSYGATLFNPQAQTASALDLMDAHPQAQLSDEYSYFKLLSLMPIPGLTDFEEVDLGPTRYVFALDNQGEMFRYIFDQGQWSSPSQVQGLKQFRSVDPNGGTGIYGIFADGTYCSLNPQRMSCQSQRQAWPERTKSFVKYGNTTLSLGDDGVVRATNGSVFAPLAGVKVLQLVSVPQYNAFE